jgi:hypothetical protein
VPDPDPATAGHTAHIPDGHPLLTDNGTARVRRPEPLPLDQAASSGCGVGRPRPGERGVDAPPAALGHSARSGQRGDAVPEAQSAGPCGLRRLRRTSSAGTYGLMRNSANRPRPLQRQRPVRPQSHRSPLPPIIFR